MSSFLRVIALVSALAFFGCYHATVETGLSASTEVINESFASSWIYGLVPPNPISTMAKCPNGVAKVETQLSFVNQLVGFVTLGIYTPMEIKVTCAAKSSTMIPSTGPDIVVQEGATAEQIRQAFMKAADMAVTTHKPIYIEY